MAAFRSFCRILVVGGYFAAFAGCMSKNEAGGLAMRCEDGLNAGYRALDLAKARGRGGSPAWNRAATLLTDAKVQQQFDRFDRCVQQVNRATPYLRQASAPK